MLKGLFTHYNIWVPFSMNNLRINLGMFSGNKLPVKLAFKILYRLFICKIITIKHFKSSWNFFESLFLANMPKLWAANSLKNDNLDATNGNPWAKASNITPEAEQTVYGRWLIGIFYLTWCHVAFNYFIKA